MLNNFSALALGLLLAATAMIGSDAGCDYGQCDWDWLSRIDTLANKMISMYNNKASRPSLQNTIRQFTDDIRQGFYDVTRPKPCIKTLNATCFECLFMVLKKIPQNIVFNNKSVHDYWLTGWEGFYNRTLSEYCD